MDSYLSDTLCAIISNEVKQAECIGNLYNKENANLLRMLLYNIYTKSIADYKNSFDILSDVLVLELILSLILNSTIDQIDKIVYNSFCDEYKMRCKSYANLYQSHNIYTPFIWLSACCNSQNKAKLLLLCLKKMLFKDN